MKRNLTQLLLLGGLFTSLMCCAVLAGAESAPSPIVATINHQSITLSDVDAEAGAAFQQIVDPKAQAQIRAQVLNALINQTLVDQAIAQSNLKESPDFQAKLNKLQKQLQVNLYIENRVGKLPAVNPKFIDQYYKNNPDLFEKRRMYHYAIMTIFADGKIDLPEVEKAINITGIEGLKKSLKSRHVSWTNNNNWTGSDQIGSSLLTILKGAGEGQYKAQISPDKQVILVIRNIASYSDPVSFAEASPVITKQAGTQMAKDAGENILAELHQRANIQIKDQVLKTEIDKQILPDKGLKPATLLDQLKITWLFAMFILVPAALFAFYRMGIPAAQADDIARPSLFEAIKKILSPRVNYSIHDVHIPKGNWHKEEEEDRVLAEEPVYDDDVGNVTLSPIFRMLFVVIMGVWLLQPSVQFFGAIPGWLSLQKIILLAFGGIGVGIVLSLVCWKGPYIQKLFGNRWVGIGLVLIVHRILLLV